MSNIELDFAPDVMVEECPSRQVLRHMTSRWGALVLIALCRETPLRFSELRRAVRGVSERMLAQTLQQLEGDGLILRRAFDVVPPHVEYGLTSLGEGAAQRLLHLVDWIESNLGEIVAKRGESSLALSGDGDGALDSDF